MKKFYRKIGLSPGSKYTINDLDQCDIKFLLELIHEESESDVIQYADGLDYV